MRKPIAPHGKLPCGHPAYVYDLERGCMAYNVPKGSDQERLEGGLCGELFSYVTRWGERHPVRFYWRSCMR